MSIPNEQLRFWPRVALIAGLSVLPLAVAQACGPWFPSTLLDNRGSTLLDLPESNFAFEAAHLLTPPEQGLVLSESAYEGDVEKDRVVAEGAGLSAEQQASIANMRTATDAERAYAAGVGLPEDVRQYTAGAVAYRNGQHDLAREHFEAVLALPGAERMRRAVWAQFMLAEMLSDPQAAASGFEQVRKLAVAGNADPAGLAVASFGEQARRLHETDPAAAIRLYAGQASYGSASGKNSLLFIARELMRDQSRIAAEIGDPLTLRLMVAYGLSRRVEMETSEGETGDANGRQMAPAAIETLLNAADAAKLEAVEGADRLAALAYQTARYDLAQRWVAKSSTPLAQWLTAKLALRRGDQAGAEKALAAAAKAFPAEERWNNPQDAMGYDFEMLEPACRTSGELGVLALSRGDYLLALEQLFRARNNYWTDLAYIAERVVTVDELKTFVDREAAQAETTEQAVPSDTVGYQTRPKAQLRHLLARRLMRAARYDEALQYFDSAELKSAATAYRDALAKNRGYDRIARAHAMYEAATLARHDGLELLGFEGDPDYFIYGGSFDLNSPEEPPEGSHAKLPARSDLKLAGEYIGDGERQRVAASRADPLSRYHYRVTATRLAEQSADLLPPRSQAFAAVLCQATYWVIDREPERAQQLYKRYLKQGPYVKWGRSFGRECPQPDWDGAARRLRHERWLVVRHWAPWGLIGAGVLLGIAGLSRWRKRRR